MQSQIITAQPGQTIQITGPAPAAATSISPQDLAKVAAEAQQINTTEPPPPPPAVIVTERFFASLDGVVVGAIAALMIVLLARLLQTLMVHLALRKAIAANHPVAADLVERINRPFEPAGPPEMPGDDRNGLVLVAIGAAMAAGGLVLGKEDLIRLAFAAAFFPLFVGIALLVRRRMVLREIAQEEAAG